MNLAQHLFFSLVSIAAAFDCPAMADDRLVVEIWPNGPPNDSTQFESELIRMSPRLERRLTEATEPTRMITNVSKPTITICRPAKELDTGTTMLIFPGGGYWNLYWEVEGEEVADWLVDHGVTAVIVKYRVPRRNGELEREPAPRPLQDAQRAMSLVRGHTGGVAYLFKHNTRIWRTCKRPTLLRLASSVSWMAKVTTVVGYSRHAIGRVG